MPDKIRIGCGEWGFRDLPMAEHFKICRSFGFKTMEIGIGGGKVGRLPVRMSEGEIAGFRQQCLQSGISTPFCCIENDFTLASAVEHEKMLEEVLVQMKLAKQLGATYIRLFAGFTPAAAMSAELWRRMLQALAQCAVLAGDLGQVIALETHGKIAMINGAAHHEHTVTTDPMALKRLLSELPDGIGFNYDPGNIKAVAPDERTYAVDILNDRIIYCHLKDWRRVGGGWSAVAPGDDDLDYKVLLKKLRYDGIYLIEYEPTEDIVAGIQRSLDYLKRIAQIELA